MAELLLKIGTVGPDPAYQDGDIVCAFNQKRIYHVHAQHICDVKNFGFNSFGLRPSQSLSRTYYEKIYKFKFVRINRYEIKRINLDTLSEEILSNIPNDRNEYIHVTEYVNHQRKHSMHKIFGEVGKEFWYGGARSPTDIGLNNVWNEIEAKTAYRKINFSEWPLTDTELKHYLAIKVDDFNDAEAEDLSMPELKIIGQEIIVIKKRKNFVDWRGLSLGQSINDIVNTSIKIDIRQEIVFDKILITNAKPVAKALQK